VAGNVFDLFRDTSRPALPRTVFEPFRRAEFDARYGDWSIREVGNDGKSAFYAMKDGHGRVVCVGSGPAHAKPGRVIGSLGCSPGYLTEQRPLYYEVTAGASRADPVMRPLRVRGVAIDGIARVAVVNPAGERRETDVKDHVFTLAQFPEGDVFRIEALDGDRKVVASEDLEGFGPAASRSHPPILGPRRPRPADQRTLPPLPAGGPLQRAATRDATLAVYANGFVALRVSESSPAARIIGRQEVALVCFHRTVVDGVPHLFGMGDVGGRTSGLELRGRIAAGHQAPIVKPPFDGCGVSATLGRRWNDPRGMHMPVEVPLTPAGRRFFGERAAAHDLAFFVRSKHINAFRRQLKRDRAARLPLARTIVAGLPSRVVALSSQAGPLRAGQIGVWSQGRKLVLATKAADGRRFSVALQDGRVVQQHLGGLTSAF
jgi:hypothetical protein